MNGLHRILIALMVLVVLLGQVTAAEAQTLPDKAAIDLHGSAQRFSLSCESRSAVDWAAYWGVEIREKKFLSNLPRSDNPDAGFVGNPNGIWGQVPPQPYGVHAGPVAALLRQFGLDAQSRSGLTWDDLRFEVAAGRPVIVWVIGQMWNGKAQKYRAQDGGISLVARYEHTMILVGYTPDSVRLQDAFSGRLQTYPLHTFLRSWDVLGRMAITGGGLLTAPQKETPVVMPDYPEKWYLPLMYQVADLVQSAQPQSSVKTELSELPSTYRVKRGDYLVALARSWGVNWRKLAELNRIAYPYTIFPGQVLKIP